MSDYVIPEDELRSQAAQDGITHLSTGVAIVRAGKLLIVRREPNDFLGSAYELPGGGVDEGETLAEAVRREVVEEVGLTVTKIIGMFPGFEYSAPSKPKVRQLNFLVEVADGDVVLSVEHDAWQWANADDVAKISMTPESRQSFRNALDLVSQATAS